MGGLQGMGHKLTCKDSHLKLNQFNLIHQTKHEQLQWHTCNEVILCRWVNSCLRLVIQWKTQTTLRWTRFHSLTLSSYCPPRFGAQSMVRSASMATRGEPDQDFIGVYSKCTSSGTWSSLWRIFSPSSLTSSPSALGTSCSQARLQVSVTFIPRKTD